MLSNDLSSMLHWKLYRIFYQIDFAPAMKYGLDNGYDVYGELDITWK
jgi:hypothetical protein